ncbi:heavy metal translocating P-type ATPase [Shewanella sp. JNE10-2]|uniref:heavy metal translocating P-type ATPase n=1 Tax=unclassified Shewanella TaxID=196818 RepID=UPI0020055125|nr:MULTISPECIES: heavy metal translocating P-type ATPase [unclassified Shewanella]MCK7631693.1 heavy metal translocating P-type ATPase [Shewanella sp. JNE9-1]MCK7643461.1 heavy metal translocating P-type ATPase [Shewanella sp. JNE3-1]MCK7654953.1 heavy metal translocating P-type ATPase [Shewanella sp. JNE4-1]UPO25642.1 heavy metal translocating P-type ATPase [Shewanella sp. JNE10-2]UPO36627.1 heavy metal translocating P-type ATPase [Shewanella sp. JNE7]
MSLIRLYVTNMNCAGCVAKIEKAFAVQEGVEARVNLADKQVTINGTMGADVAIELMASAGFSAEVIVDAKAAAEEKRIEDAAEYRLRMRQAIIALAIGIPMMLWGLLGGEMMINSPSMQLGWGIMGLITLLLLVTTGRHFYQGMWRALKAKTTNMDTLIVLGTSTAWAYSMLVVILPNVFPLDTRHVYFEASVMILGLINLGHALELKARGKTSEAVQRLLGLQSTTAIRIGDKGDEQVEISQLKLGDKLRLRPGDRVALDGIVEMGQSLLDEAMLTGEPIPVVKNMGDNLSAGTVNGNGSLVYRVTAGPQDTRLAKIIALVQEAQTSKLPIGRLADKISAVFVPTVVAIALLAAAIWYFVGPAPALSHALVVLTSVLIIACPCALGLATPMSIMVAVGRAAQMGVLVKNGEALQTASRVDCVVLDKTGTVTLGKPQVTDFMLVQALSDTDKGALLGEIASLEQHSEHPLAGAIVSYAKESLSQLPETQAFTNHQGKGIEGKVDGVSLAIGNLALMTALDIVNSDGSALDPSATLSFANQGKTPIYVAKAGKLVATIALADPIKADAKTAISAMLQQDIRVVLLTGDNPQTAQAVADQVGITEVIAGVLPEQKQQHIKALQQQGHIVAMVGDGINDAPALMSADVGIAMGSGTEVAIESADMTLLSHQLIVIANLLALSRATITNIKQNLFGAFVYNSLGIPVAAGVLYPLTGMLLSPVIAGAAMALSSLTVVTNANRLRKQKL